jgi:hypothetical protein
MENRVVAMVPVILNGKEDWDEWIELIKTAAIGAKIWEYVNPEAPKKDPPPEPIQPTPETVKPTQGEGVRAFSGLDKSEVEELRNLQQEWQRQLKLQDRREEGFAALRSAIQRTVSRANLQHTFNCDTTRDMLVALHKRFCPTAQYREREVEAAYSRMRAENIGKSTEVDEYLSRWEAVYTRASKIQLPEVQGTRSTRDFLSSINHFAPDFASYWQNKMIDDDQPEDHVHPDLYAIIAKYREYRGRSGGHRSKAGYHSAFPGARFQGKDQAGKHSPCLCGAEHRFSKCPYLIPQQRTADWEPDPILKHQVATRLQENQYLRELIEDIRRYAIEHSALPSAPDSAPTIL